MRPTFFALFLLAATPAFAQNQIPPQPPITATTPALPPDLHIILPNCPVGMSAQQRGAAQTLWTISLEDAGQPQNEQAARSSNAGVHVELHSGKSTIRQVELEVYFVAPGARVVPVTEDPAPVDLKKTFHLSAQDGATLKLAGDLLVGPAAGITRVRLLSIDYADGTTWHANAHSTCSVEPSRFMLVNAR
jgi:hypothetical protein